jgi:urease accessory protein
MDALPSHETLQRARGRLRIAFGSRDGRTVLRDLFQEGALKARFPRAEPGTWPAAVLLNTGGGIAGGDALVIEATALPAAHCTITTQAAERVYRALPDDAPSRIETTLRIHAGATLEWLPQEMILFNAARLDRRLAIEIAPDARYLGVEALVFGRAASGEVLRQGWIRDRIRLTRDGQPLYQDSLRLEGDIAAQLARPAIGGGAGAVATLLLAAADAEAQLEPLRAAWAASPGCAASAWPGLLVGRILASNGALLRAAIVAGLNALRSGRAVPRLWNS